MKPAAFGSARVGFQQISLVISRQSLAGNHKGLCLTGERGRLSNASRRGFGGFQMRLLIAVCCVVAWGGVACAEGKHANTQGVGNASCAEYGKEYQRNPVETDFGYLSWAQGFISGINAMEDAYFDLRDKPLEEMLRFLHKYCNDHPLAIFGDGVIKFMESLPRVKRKDDAPALR
jgi:hypothetical protein